MFGHVSSSVYLVGADHRITVGSLLFLKVYFRNCKMDTKSVKVIIKSDNFS